MVVTPEESKELKQDALSWRETINLRIAIIGIYPGFSRSRGAGCQLCEGSLNGAGAVAIQYFHASGFGRIGQ